MNFIKICFIVLFILSTVLTLSIHPPLHDPVVIEDSNFKLIRISDEIAPQNMPTLTVNMPETVEVATPQTTTVEVYQQPQTTQETIINVPVSQNETKKIVNVIPKQTKQETKIVKIQETPSTTKNIKISTPTTNTSQNELLERIAKNANKPVVVETPIETKKTVEVKTPPKQTETKTVKTTPVQTQTQPIQQPKPQTQTKTVQPATQTNKNPYMTEQEEIIAWNIWRSNIQNQIMKDSDIGFAPQGTVFTFSFVVDKFGNVSNIKVECSHPYFMDTARAGVKPAISRLQGKPILNFPKGTQRTVTTVNGNFVISTQNIFSTPGDFSDYERVKR